MMTRSEVQIQPMPHSSHVRARVATVTLLALACGAPTTPPAAPAAPANQVPEAAPAIDLTEAGTPEPLSNGHLKQSAELANTLARLQSLRPNATGEYKLQLESLIASRERQYDLSERLAVIKIVEGKPAREDQFPYQVSIGFAGYTNPWDAHFCGGSLVEPNWVLTAAHCVAANVQPGDIVIYTGITKLSTATTPTAIDRIVRHEAYNDRNHENDIAMLHLASSVQAKQLVRVPTPAEMDQVLKVSRMAVVSGWGDTKEGSHRGSDDLLFVSIPVLENADCNKPQSYSGRVFPSMLCAGGGNKDSCQGDSGGPLTVQLHKEPLQIGIVSWGDGCGRQGVPGVYTRVANFTAWVQKAMSVQ